MSIFSYKILTYREDINDNKYVYETFTGLGFADNYTEAAQKLERTYGDEIVEILSLFLMDTGSIIALPEEVVEDYKNTEFPDITYGVRTDSKGVPLNVKS